MTVDERFDRLEKAIEAQREFLVSRAEGEAEIMSAFSESLGEVMEALVVLADAVDKLEPEASSDSLEVQHQRFKRDAQEVG